MFRHSSQTTLLWEGGPSATQIIPRLIYSEALQQLGATGPSWLQYGAFEGYPAGKFFSSHVRFPSTGHISSAQTQHAVGLKSVSFNINFCFQIGRAHV